MRRHVAVFLLVVVACVEAPPPLEGVDLPLAEVPDNVEPAGWSVAFSHEFGAGFWEEGEHVYQLELACPGVLGQPTQTPPIFFDVERLAVPVDHVYLRLSGPADSRLGPPNVGSFSPQQATTALITVVGLTESVATAAVDRCAGQVTWDLNSSADLLPLEVFEP